MLFIIRKFVPIGDLRYYILVSCIGTYNNALFHRVQPMTQFCNHVSITKQFVEDIAFSSIYMPYNSFVQNVRNIEI